MKNNYLRIRVYNTGVGNCTLLSTYKNQHRFHMLIDFGTTDRCAQSSNLSSIANDISRETASDGLDVISISHTHMDHIMGLCPQENQTVRVPIPKQLWMPINCNPNYRNDYSYRQVQEASKCHKQLSDTFEVIFAIVKLLYYRRTDPCIEQLARLYGIQNTSIRFWHSNSRPHFVTGPYRQFTIEFLHPPPAAQPIIMSLLRLIPESLLREIGISEECISSLYPEETRKDENEKELSDEFDRQMRNLFYEVFSEEDIDFEEIWRKNEHNKIKILPKKARENIRKLFSSICTGQPPSFRSLQHICKCIGDSLDAKQIRPIDLAHSIIPMRDHANEFSMVVRVNWEGRKLMFPGDLKYWRFITPRLQPLNYLEASHHGSKYNLPNEFQRGMMLQSEGNSNMPCVMVPTCADIGNQPCCGTSGPNPEQCDEFYSSVATLYHSSQAISNPLYTDFIFYPDSAPQSTWKVLKV